MSELKCCMGFDDDLCKRFYTNVFHFATILPAKDGSNGMFCLQRYQGLMIDRLLV